MIPYIVVFEFTDAAGDYCGVRTQTPFSSQDAFNSAREELLWGGKKKVLAEGISADEALARVRETPIQCYIRACIAKATEPDGSFDEDRFLADLHILLELRSSRRAA